MFILRASMSFLLLSLCLSFPAATQSREIYLAPTVKPMTVQDVIKLSKGGGQRRHNYRTDQSQASELRPFD